MLTLEPRQQADATASIRLSVRVCIHRESNDSEAVRSGTRAAMTEPMRSLPRIVTVVMGMTALYATGCRETDSGNIPVGTKEESPLAQERFLKRLGMDLTGQKPDESTLRDQRARLETEGNTPAVRGAIATELIRTRAFGETFVDEIEPRAFSGLRADTLYPLLCSAFAEAIPECASCVEQEGFYDDPCACECADVAAFRSEWDSILAAPDDLVSGEASTSAIARRFAQGDGLIQGGGTAEGIAIALFDAFLGRAPEAEEIRNVRALTLGVEGVKGILFGKIGGDYADLVDIVFESPVYREASVGQVFSRYLGRDATPEELGHFTRQLDPEDPDVRGVIVSVVSSQEYFDQ